MDSSGNIYVADETGETIRKLAPDGTVTTVAGKDYTSGNSDGTGSAVEFDVPSWVCIDKFGYIYITDANNGTVRRMSPAGDVITVAGQTGIPGTTDGPGEVALFGVTDGIGVDSPNTNNIYVADRYHATIRQIVVTGETTYVAPGYGGGASEVITVVQGANGTISPGSQYGVSSGASQSFTITPSTGYQVASVLVDGQSVGAVTSYTFPSVVTSHTITASFSAIPASAATSTSSVASGGGEGAAVSTTTTTISTTTASTATTTPSITTGTTGSLAPQSQLLTTLIAELQTLLQQAQAEGIALPPAATAYLTIPATTTTFTRDLQLGMSGSDVRQLQAFLISQNAGPAAKELAAIGATSYFGQLTKAALTEFQASVHITPASGYFGPKTRSYIYTIR